MYESTAPAAVALGLGGASLIAGTALLIYGLRRRSRGARDIALLPARRGLALRLQF